MLCNYCHVEFLVGFSEQDLDRLKALLAASSHIEAKSSRKVDIEDCKLSHCFLLNALLFMFKARYLLDEFL